MRSSQDVVRAQVRLVNVYAYVTDAKGRPAAALTSADFQIEEDGKPQKMAHFSHDANAPASIGLLFDKSYSMAGRIGEATDMLLHFARTLRADDDIFLLAFDDATYLLQDFTDNRKLLSAALQKIKPGGGTALYDAISEGIEKVRYGRNDKHAILVITDGDDTGSQLSLSDLRSEVRSSESLVYALGVSSDASGRRDDMTTLETVASDSGGRAFRIAGIGFGLGKILTEISTELRSQYTLAYYPDHGDDGRFHKIEVIVPNGYHVRARQGYTARASE